MKGCGQHLEKDCRVLIALRGGPWLILGVWLSWLLTNTWNWWRSCLKPAFSAGLLQLQELFSQSLKWEQLILENKSLVPLKLQHSDAVPSFYLLPTWPLTSLSTCLGSTCVCLACSPAASCTFLLWRWEPVEQSLSPPSGSTTKLQPSFIQFKTPWTLSWETCSTSVKSSELQRNEHKTVERWKVNKGLDSQNKLITNKLIKE